MEMVLVAALCGIAVGMLSGLLGIGGGVVMVPLFRLIFGLEPLTATATSLFTIIPTSVSGMAKHMRNRTCIPRVGAICGLAGAVLSPVGVLAASVSPAWLVMLAAAAIIAYSAVTMFKKALAAPRGERGAAGSKRAGCTGQAGQGAPACAAQAGAARGEAAAAPRDRAAVERDARAEGKRPASAATAPHAAGRRIAASVHPAADAFRPALTPLFVAKIVAIGVLAGFMSGYVGVGGGFVMVPLFMALLGVPMRLASGTSLLAVCILAIPGAVEQGILGNIDYLVGIATAAGSIPGAVLGASLVKRVPERALRFAFAAFLLVVAAILALNEFGVIG